MELPWQRFVMFGTVAVIILLIASNILLLQIVLDDDRSTKSEAQSNQVAAPALPAPSRPGTSRALLKELDKTKKQLQEPLSQALTGLDSVSASAAALDQIPFLLNQMVAQTAQLEDVAPELHAVNKRLKSLNKQISKLTAFAVGLGPVAVDLELTLRAMSNDLAKIRACVEKPDSCK